MYISVEGASRSHDTSRVRSPQQVLPSSNVNLSQRPAIGRRVNIVKVSQRLRIVANKVLGAGPETLALNTVDDGARQLSRQQRVLAEALKVSSRARVAVDVDRRAQDDLRALLTALVSEALTQTAEKLGVPGRSEAGCVRETRCCEVGRDS